MKVLCVKTVISKDGKQTFTEGSEYVVRKRSMQGLRDDPYEVELVLRAKNDLGEQHIIKRVNGDIDSNKFFSTHFVEMNSK
jgi:hypothetical protein